MDILLRHLHSDGVTSLETTSYILKLPIPVLDSLFRELRAQQLVTVKGSVGDDY